jgi:DNA-directed RNA polymerase
MDFCFNTSETYFYSHLPIQLDAGCNGFQHLVLLSGDTNLRKQLNLTSSDYSKKPYDFYSYILEILKDNLKSLVLSTNSLEEKESYERIEKFCLERSLIKKMIMTIPYNATTRTMVDNIASLLVKIKEKKGDIEVL